MIISASRRTDIPTYYAEWLENRIREGYALVRNPMNPAQVSRVSLAPQDVDGMVLWTKNPLPLMSRLSALDAYMYVVQFTLNGYGRDIETNLPDKDAVLVPAFRRLAERIGPERMIWRYDPILICEGWGVEAHLRAFEHLAAQLHSCTGTCTISFVDDYRAAGKRMAALGMRPPTLEEMHALAAGLSEIAHGYGIAIHTCAEEIDLQQYGIGHARCVDDRLFERLLGRPLYAGRDRNQRKACGCAQSVDIGAYDTCMNGCLYCYANHSGGILAQRRAAHDPRSPMLCGWPAPQDRVTERGVKRNGGEQLRFDL
ncbi:MAG: DUF1848 domain-containing protein [Clostridia bacterium]|nr:DUF1848 domain-containing protein [Clostridia bacterium]